MPWLPSGAQIGITANFNSTLDDLAGITNSTILINGKEVEWNSDIGTALKDALVFSPEAKKFAMVRAILLGRGDGLQGDPEADLQAAHWACGLQGRS